MLRALLQKIFNFAKESENKNSGGDSAKKQDALAECFALLRQAKNQQNENLDEEALLSLEKVIDIIEREGF